MKKIRVTQIKSGIKQTERQKRTLKALGLKKLHKPIEHNATPQIEGMVRAISHLLKVEEI